MKLQLALIIATTLLLVGAIIVEKTYCLTTWQLLLVYLVPYLLVGHDTLKEAAEGLLHGDAMNEHLLMSVATIGALAIGFLPGAENEFKEAVFVMLFFQVGELFEGIAEGQSRRSIAHLMDLRPETVCVERPDSEAVEPRHTTVSPEDVLVGEVIVVRPGERIPLDGVIIEGSTQLNTVALTGESMPRSAAVGDDVASGCVNMSGVLRIRTTKAYGDSTVARIISLVEQSADRKSHSETFITRFARVYTPIVVVAALVLALVPTLWLTVSGRPFDATWIYRALMFLVVSCPCALVISVPLTFFGALGGASRRGILIKGANYIDTLAKVGTVVFDKTGTLTHGRFAVEAVHPDECDEQQLLHLAAHVEHFSTHPIGAALRDAFPQEATDGCSVSDVEEVAGHGIRARVGDDMVCVGNSRMMEAAGASWHDCPHDTGTVVHVAINGRYAGHIVINDVVKPDSAEAIRELKRLGVSRTVMLTGDRPEVAARVARQLAIDEHHGGLLPQDKVAFIDSEITKHQAQQTARNAQHSTHDTIAFVGDGINDAPVLARADVGVAMGALGSDAAIEAADVVLMDDKPTRLADAISIARRTLAIARQNVVFAIGIKVLVLLLAALGVATMWMAVFADVGVTVIAVLNAMRTLHQPGLIAPSHENSKE